MNKSVKGLLVLIHEKNESFGIYNHLVNISHDIFFLI